MVTHEETPVPMRVWQATGGTAGRAVFLGRRKQVRNLGDERGGAGALPLGFAGPEIHAEMWSHGRVGREGCNLLFKAAFVP